jgi:hypothetical protein
MKGVGVILVVIFALAASVAAGGIRPTDQKVAERLTLRLSDFPSGWRMSGKPSTRIHFTCPTAPKLVGAITGYSASAFFGPVHHQIDKRNADSETILFASLAAAKRYYRWAGGGEGACVQAEQVAYWKKTNPSFKIYGLHHERETFLLHCSSCPPHQLSAWQIGYTIELPGRERWFIDWVAVRTQRVVTVFYFFSAVHPFGPDGRRLVSTVLERA